MAKSKKESSPSKTSQQLRGEALRERIEAVIRGLAAKARKAGVQYEYNASEIARMVPTTRKSLAKHGELVAFILLDLDARRRMATGEATAEHLRDQVAYLKEKIAGRDKIIAALRAHHIDIYKRFHEHSLDAELLIRPILHKESEEAGGCILCGVKADPSAKSRHKSNVIQLQQRKSVAASK
ncbi:hypothetical protein [Stenotrophomonas sp. Marseille-Q4652]|uniref:hypothetical protein n=1 Tax=Stenotrophomonas sp. Marseille-Q4652 TaxID=2866595 RepID=UPI001CE449C8|nr:hypothetical protein [Stenotrophomonas sp. Marseille-Q4652]